MPTPHYTRVVAFMERAGQAVPRVPTIPDEDTRLLRARLILEEALETIEALGVTASVTPESGADPVRLNGSNVVFRGEGPIDLEGVVDGCADISVVTTGTFIAFGIDDEPVLEEVDRANLRKFGPGSYARPDGKWMKPPDWTPPDINGVIERQRQNGLGS